MFQLFFWEYKHTIYNKFFEDFKRLPWMLKILMVIGIALAISFVVLVMMGNALISKILLGSIMVWCAAWIGACYISGKKMHDSNIERYRTETQQPLKELLENEKFNLYSVADVDWLISSCGERIEGRKNPIGIFNSFSIFVIPVIIKLIDVFIDGASEEYAAEVVFLILVIWLLLCMLKFALSDFIEYIRFPDRNALSTLKSDLQYLQLGMKKEIEISSSATENQKKELTQSVGSR